MSATKPQALAEACAETMWTNDRASQGLGMSLDKVAPGEATISMTVTAAMCNGLGDCHGGYLFTLADSAFAFACNTHNQHAVAQHGGSRSSLRHMRTSGSPRERARCPAKGAAASTTSAS